MKIEVEIFSARRCILGEGPVWDERSQVLSWVDIRRGEILQKPLEGETHVLSFDDMPSALAKIEGADDYFLVAFSRGLFRVHRQSGQRTCVYDLTEEPDHNRCNDGACGPDGQFWFGTMDHREVSDTGALYSFNGKALHCFRKGIGVSNTFAWSPDREYFYFADSKRQAIYRYRYSADAGFGSISEPEVFVSLKGTSFYPDGSCVDAQGYLWNAQWDGARVVRYDPQGREDLVVPIPALRPTSLCFGGEDLKQVFVTSAAIGCSIDQDPMAGSVFTFRVPVSGQSSHRYCM